MSGDADSRLPWLDTARGICIILVVMVHFYSVYFEHLNAPQVSKKIFDAAVSAWRPARMPAFFFISGFLASRALVRPWGQIVRSRILRLYWVYLIWSVVMTLTLFALFEPFSAENVRRFVEQVAVQVVFARQTTWFLYGLIVFFVAARLLRSHPRTVIVIALLCSAFAEQIDDLVVSQMVRTMPYFLIGIYYPHLLIAACDRASAKRVVVLGCLYAACVVPVLIDRTFPGVWLPSSVAGIILVLNMACALPASRTNAVLRYIGRNTLPIYVMHVPILLILRDETQARLMFVFPFGLLYAATAIVLLLAGCLGLAFVLKKMGFDWLFDLPSRLAPDRRMRPV